MALIDSPTGSVSVEGASQTNPLFGGTFTDAGENSIISQTFAPFQSLMTDAAGNTIVSQTFMDKWELSKYCWHKHCQPSDQCTIRKPFPYCGQDC